MPKFNTSNCLRQSFFLTLLLLGILREVKANSGPERPSSIVAVCNASVNVSLDLNGEANLIPEYIDAGSFDSNGPISSMTLSPNYFNCDQVGTTQIVLLTVTGPSGTNQCWSEVTIEDKITPVAVCDADVFITLDGSGSAVIPAEIINAGSYDNCSASLTFSLSQNEFTCADLGTSIVLMTVTDGGGNSNNCFSTFHVSDLTPPIAVCEAEISLALDPSGHAVAEGWMVAGGSYDNCGIASYTITGGQTNFDCSDAGDLFLVEVTLLDAGGLSSICYGQIFIVDPNPDADCDGISDVCDVCPGGDDSVDNNGDGLPDCAFPPAFSGIIPSWICGNGKVYICHNNVTKCIKYNGLAAHIAHGDFLGPCDNAACLGKAADKAPDSKDTHWVLGESPELSAYVSGSRANILLGNLTSNGELRVIDPLGRIMNSTFVAAGTTSIELDITSLKDGLYFVVLSTQGEQSSCKMLLNR